MSIKFQPGDYHLVVADSESKKTSTGKLFDHLGNLRHEFQVLAKGQTPDYDKPSGDTPPGLYVCGELTVTQDYEPQSTWLSYGKYFIDLVELEDQEISRGRAGVGIHGGGTALGNKAQDSYQDLLYTLGCIRMHNRDLEVLVHNYYLPCVNRGNKVYVTVHQLDK